MQTGLLGCGKVNAKNPFCQEKTDKNNPETVEKLK